MACRNCGASVLLSRPTGFDICTPNSSRAGHSPMYITDYEPGKKLVIESSSDQKLMWFIASGALLLIVALPVLLLGLYCFIFKAPLPLAVARWLTGAQVALSLLILWIGFISNARRFTFSPTEGSGVRVERQPLYSLPFSIGRECLHGTELYIHRDKNWFGDENTLSVATGKDDLVNVLSIPVFFVHSPEDVAHFALCVANATGLNGCQAVTMALGEGYKLTASPESGGTPVPPISACEFPRGLCAVTEELARAMPFSPDDIARLARVHDWQPGRRLELKPTELKERLLFGALGTGGVFLAYTWIQTVLIHWEKGTFADRALWITSLTLLGGAAALCRVVDLLVTGGTRIVIEPELCRSAAGLIRGTPVPVEEISSVCVHHGQSGKIRVCLLAGRKSDMLIGTPPAESGSTTARAAIMLALEVGRILKCPVRVSTSLVEEHHAEGVVQPISKNE